MIVSDRRLAANRSNALLSTGPKTELGKRVSRANALRHGLSRPLSTDPAATRSLDRLTSILARSSNGHWYWELAQDLAETILDVQRIRAVRWQIVSEIGELESATLSNHWKATAQLELIWRYEQRGLSRYRKALAAYLNFEQDSFDS